MHPWNRLCLLTAFGAAASTSFAAATLVLHMDKPGAKFAKEFQGIFFEDINFGGDGGISAELVKNGSFEFEDPIYGWNKKELAGTVGGYGVRSEEPAFENNPTYVRVTLYRQGEGFRLRNEGYRGMAFQRGARYRFSAYARVPGEEAAQLAIQLLGENDKVIGSATITAAGKQWARVEAELVADASEAKGALAMTINGARTIELDGVSLMPVNTWKQRANGLRPDLVQRLADLKPGFVRFPGGCIVEGRTLDNRYRWKDTVGPVENRRQIYNRWNVEFAGRGAGATDYYQSFRVGFFEYFQLCADLGATPVPILNCGIACQFNSGELAPLEDLQPYIQDALDLIEFANGDASTPWGAVRAEMGHPEPFGMTYLGVGNEQWGPQYFERYKAMADAVRAAHPEIKLVFSSGPFPGDEYFHAAWKAVPRLQVDVVDEHSYAKPEWFLDNADRYDRQDRNGPKIFMGEYAAHVENRKNNWESALAEAAFLTGLERNADVVVMSSYAPLFAHVDATQWSPNLIWFNNTQSYGTANYEVQKLYAFNRGDMLVPVDVEGAPATANGRPRLYASASRDSASGELIVKVVNATAETQEVVLRAKGSAPVGTTILRVVMAGALAEENTFDNPNRVVPRAEEARPMRWEEAQSVPAHSVTVFRIR